MVCWAVPEVQFLGPGPWLIQADQTEHFIYLLLSLNLG